MLPRLGSVLGGLGSADLALLQEVSMSGLPRFCEAAGLDWWVHVGGAFPDLLRVRGRTSTMGDDGRKKSGPRCVALAGQGAPLRGATPFPDVPLPEKVLAGWVDFGGAATSVVSYHAPTGVQHHEKKPEQAVRVARWLRGLDGPVVFGGDFNTPEVDPPDFDRVRTHWHSGNDNLADAPGDDLLIGPEPVHGLRDVLRIYLAEHPSELEAIRAEHADGPLATSYCTDHGGQNEVRYDAVWLSPHFDVSAVAYHYREAIEAGTDHALVLVDAVLSDRRSLP